jgi:hypothetical protein
VSEADLAAVARQEQIDRFAAAYVYALGLHGDLATETRLEVEQMLVTRQPIDHAALVTRVRQQHQRDAALQASGSTQRETDAISEQLYGTTNTDRYRGEVSRLLELEVQGDVSARARVDEQCAAAYSDERVSNEQVETLERLVHDTRGE